MKRLFVIFALMVFSKLSFAQRFQYSEEVQFGRYCFIIEVNCGGTVTDPQTGGTKCILDGWIYTSDCSGNKTGDSSVYHVERPITPNWEFGVGLPKRMAIQFVTVMKVL